jgi:hypothetical protein
MEIPIVRQPQADFHQLLYSSQYFLGPRAVEKFDNWNIYKIRDDLWLTAHPNLSVFQSHDRNWKLTLLGYMLDPNNPGFTDSEIIESLFLNSANFDDVISKTFGLGGRWLLIADHKNHCRVYPDATGLRQLFYTDTQYSKERWCLSQPNLVKEVLDCQMDQNAEDFIKWLMNKSPEHWWPGTSSPYLELKALIPNHYLDVDHWRSIRFWPITNLQIASPDDSIEKLKSKLYSIMECAANRFELAVGISLGLDSRLMLASCRQVKEKITFYTVKSAERSDNHPDIEIPCRLASKLELNHHIIDQRNFKTSNAFKDLFIRQAPFPHTKRLNGQQKNLEYFKREKVAVTGNASEIGRCYLGVPKYRLRGKNKIERSGEAIASVFNFDGHPFAVVALDQWISELKEYFNFNVLDLLHWEQLVGRWFANNCTQYDIAWKEYFTPYSNRNLLMDILSIEEKHRMPPENKLYRDLIRSLWPEVLSEPINPHKHKKTGLRKRIKLFFGS